MKNETATPTLTDAEALFLAQLVHKEISFALMAGERTAFTEAIKDFVSWEREKIDTGEFDYLDDEDRFTEMSTATSLYRKLNTLKE